MAQGQIESYMKPIFPSKFSIASIAQLGERKTEDLKVAGSIPARSILLPFLLIDFFGFDGVPTYLCIVRFNTFVFMFFLSFSQNDQN
jgi:hypothetical protein